jgi:hypothetical protein
MLSSPILNAAIGLFFIYFFFSSVCSAVQEWIAATLSWRSSTLLTGIKTLLQGDENQQLIKDLLAHGLIAGISQHNGRPSYIPSRTFSLALVDLLQSKQTEVKTGVADIRNVVKSLPGKRAQTGLLALLDDAGEDMDKFRTNIEHWFDDAMDRVSGVYKRWTLLLLFNLGLALAVLLNADSFMMARILFHGPEMSAGLAALAQRDAQRNNVDPADVEKQIDWLNFPLGWRFISSDNSANYSKDLREFPDPRKSFGRFIDALFFCWSGWLKVFGFFLTAAFVALGAPFWFDLLLAIINVRAGGPSPPRSDKG